MDWLDRFAVAPAPRAVHYSFFSATNYRGMHLVLTFFPFPFLGSVVKPCIKELQSENNAGAILVVGRGLTIVPKLIHLLPVATVSSVPRTC